MLLNLFLAILLGKFDEDSIDQELSKTIVKKQKLFESNFITKIKGFLKTLITLKDKLTRFEAKNAAKFLNTVKETADHVN